MLHDMHFLTRLPFAIFLRIELYGDSSYMSFPRHTHTHTHTAHTHTHTQTYTRTHTGTNTTHIKLYTKHQKVLEPNISLP